MADRKNTAESEWDGVLEYHKKWRLLRERLEKEHADSFDAFLDILFRNDPSLLIALMREYPPRDPEAPRREYEAEAADLLLHAPGMASLEDTRRMVTEVLVQWLGNGVHRYAGAAQRLGTISTEIWATCGRISEAEREQLRSLAGEIPTPVPRPQVRRSG